MLNEYLMNDMENTMYDTLLQLPFFQGLCKDDFTSVIEKVKFHFMKFDEQKTIVEQGQTCDNLIFVLQGEVTRHYTHSIYTLSETLTAPFVIEPYSLFGMQTMYQASYKALTHTRVLSIRKIDILEVLLNYEIIRINCLNILSNRVQIQEQALWQIPKESMEEKIIDFFMKRCLKPHGQKELLITIEDFSNIIDEPRIKLTKYLNDLHDKGIMKIKKRKGIEIPALEKLIAETKE